MILGKYFGFTLVVLDTVVLLFAFNLVGSAYGVFETARPLVDQLLLPIAITLLCLHLIDGYNPHTDLLSLTYTALHLIALVAATAVLLLLTYAVIPAGYPLQSSRFVIVTAGLGLVPLTLSYRRYLYRQRLIHRGSRHFLYLGSRHEWQMFLEECQRRGMRQTVLHAFPHVAAGTPAPRAAKGISADAEAVRFLTEQARQIDAVILQKTSLPVSPDILARLMTLQFQGVPTYSLEMFHQVYWRKIPLHQLNSLWLFQEGFQISREPVFERLKRLSDIGLSLAGLTLSLPLLPVLAAVIRLQDQGPVFFQQTRVGRNRRLFTAWKFRTMRVQHDGAAYTREGDLRITPLGRFLRHTRLDEIPQLWNVLRGDMSLIGPRAEWVLLVEEYERQIPCYHFRHLVKPGITGWAQVNYPYGASPEDARRKLEYDLYYIRHFSFVLDASIVLKTIQVVLFGQGR